MKKLISKGAIRSMCAAVFLLCAAQAHAVETVWYDWDIQAEAVADKSAAAVKVIAPCKVERMHMVLGAVDAKGQIVFAARVEWGGGPKSVLAQTGTNSAQKGLKDTLVMGVSVQAMGLDKLGDMVSAKAQPVWALCEGGLQVGSPATWALGDERWKIATRRIMPLMAKELAAAAASGKPEPMPTVANVWSESGMNPYDPKAMTVVYAWRNASAKPLVFDSATVKFFKTPNKGSKDAPKTFLSVGFKGDRLMAPKNKGSDDVGTASVQISIPGLSTEQTMAMAKAFEAHGVGIDKQYGEPGSKN